MDVKTDTTSAERFNLNPGSFNANPHTPSTPASIPFTWTLPPGWINKPATSMRLINFGVDNEPDIECYVTLLPGAGGDLLANINRWRKQMGMADIGREEALKLPEITLLGHAAKLIELEGDFTSMSGQQIKNYFLMGIIGEYNGQSLFIKMTGPINQKIKQSQNFLAVSQSLHPAHP
jgi:hypothetical protein